MQTAPPRLHWLHHPQHVTLFSVPSGCAMRGACPIALPAMPEGSALYRAAAISYSWLWTCDMWPGRLPSWICKSLNSNKGMWPQWATDCCNRSWFHGDSSAYITTLTNSKLSSMSLPRVSASSQSDFMVSSPVPQATRGVRHLPPTGCSTGFSSTQPNPELLNKGTCPVTGINQNFTQSGH